MFALLSLFAMLSLVCPILGETIVADNLGNLIGLPIAGGNATGAITNMNSRVSTSPYTLNVFINNGISTGVGVVIAGSNESFWMSPPSNGRLYGNATLQRSGYSSTFQSNGLSWNTSIGQYLGNSSRPNRLTGMYQFVFTIPVLSTILVNLTYVNIGAPQTIVDLISIIVYNPAVAVGDPQFIGLRGQSFQVHGIDGAVYNLITDTFTQVNSRFVFLDEGQCPMLSHQPEPNCWSHPGSYMGEISFQQVIDSINHRIFIRSGDSVNGFASVVFDDTSLMIGDVIDMGILSINYRSSHFITVHTQTYSFELSNSHYFINQAFRNLQPLNQLKSHGLIGQTHQAKIYSTAIRYIEGEVDDYVIAEGEIFGKDFAFNKFQY